MVSKGCIRARGLDPPVAEICSSRRAFGTERKRWPRGTVQLEVLELDAIAFFDSADVGRILQQLAAPACVRAECGIIALGGGSLAQREAAISREILHQEGFYPEESSGLFVGISTFEDEPFAPVRFAVDDAVDLAWVFSLELGLLDAGRCVLALAGEPQKEISQQRLEEAALRPGRGAWSRSRRGAPPVRVSGASSSARSASRARSAPGGAGLFPLLAAKPRSKFFGPVGRAFSTTAR